ncbi:MAG: double-strand break repair protein AddB [Bauldia sp.]|nr:double-strand break repair protein AddB [Bauldia sp.]
MAIPRVFSIPAGVPFLPALADAVLSGRLGGAAPGTPLDLAGTTILLPTRRSVRALREIFLARASRHAAILPRIRTIGDVDEEDFLLQPAAESPGDALLLPEGVSRLERSLALTRMVLAWGRAVRAQTAPEGGPPLVPASAADAVRLAADLARLIDDMETAGIPWDALNGLVPADYPGYWQLTLDFLKIAGEEWPKILAEAGLADPAARRDMLIRSEAARLETAAPAGPMIAAGSTGSIPATAALLRAIARLPNGAVVLPGLDRTLDARGWEGIGDVANGAPSHPQFGLRQLLGSIGILRDDVPDLVPSPAALAARARIVGEAMRPAETTEAWAEAPLAGVSDAFAGASLIVARNEQEEALAIAVALRESLETPRRTAALVTPDRTLARRVAVELRRWGIAVDDSAGQPLDGTTPGVFVRLLAEAALTAAPVAILALLKHPLAAFGQKPSLCRIAARALEIALFRGPGRMSTIASLAADIANVRLGMDMKSDLIIPRARRRLSKADWTAAEAMAATVSSVLGPLAKLGKAPQLAVADAAAALVVAFDRAIDDGSGSATPLWDEPAGAGLATLLGGLAEASRLELSPSEFPSFLRAAMAGATVTPGSGTDPRIHIWGTLEARLQSVDRLVLGGLDESVWPGDIRTDPFLSRQMRAAIGLPPPERRVGLSAHDFSQGLAVPEVIVTRAEKRGGAPTVPSRWLQRLTALIGPDETKALRARGDRHVRLARGLDRVLPAEVAPIRRPHPRPPVAVRPRELSITSVEKLIRDPYSVYAQRILQLEPLDPIGQRADARIRGTLIHEAFADFTREWTGRPFDDSARDRLLAIWREKFAIIADFPEVHAVWSLLAERIAGWMADWEAERDARVASRHPEIKGEFFFEAPAGKFKLNGRADRIDIFKDGSVGIYDYKTGAPPSPKQVLLFSPQLALEGAMVSAGAFGAAFAGRSLSEVAWIALGKAGRENPVRSAVDDGVPPDSIAAQAVTMLRGLVARYDDPAHGYASQARPMFERRFPGDYDHLARVSEWRLVAAPGGTP